MKNCCYAMCLALISLGSWLALGNHPSREQDTDKDDPKSASKTKTINDQMLGNEPKDKVRINSPHKVYLHEMVQGKTYLIDMVSTEFDTLLRLETPAGQQVAYDDDSGGNLNAQISYQAKQSGTYRIIATSYGASAKGKFTLTIREIEVRLAKPIELKVGSQSKTLKDKLTAEDGSDGRARPYKLYTFEGAPDKLYRMELSGLADGRLRLEEITGQLIKKADFTEKGTSTLVFRPKEDGTYYLYVSAGPSRKMGDFTLKVAASVPAKMQVEEINAAKPVKVQGELTTADGCDADGKYCRGYAFTADAGKEYRFEARGKVDPYLSLQSAEGKLLQNEDFGDPGYSQLRFRPSKKGTYHLVVCSERAGKTGPFTLTGGDRLSNARPFSVTKGQPAKISGQFTNTDELDHRAKPCQTYAFQGEAGTIYRFNVQGNSGIYLRVEQADGAAPSPPAGFVPVTNAATFVPTKTGTCYLVAVAESAPPLSAYTVTGTLLQPKVPPLIEPKYETEKVATIKGMLSAEEGLNAKGQPYQVVALKTESGKTYQMKATSTFGTPLMELQDLKGKVLQTSTFIGIEPGSQLIYSAEKAGEYRIVLIGQVGQKMPFTLTITEGKPLPTEPLKAAKLIEPKYEPVKVAKITGTISEDKGLNDKGQPYQVVALKTESGKTYQVRVTSPIGSPLLELQDLKGKVLQTSTFGPGPASTLTYSSKKEGEYRIAIIGQVGQKTSFTLTITESKLLPPQAPQKLVVQAGKPAVVNSQLTLQDQSAPINKLHKVYTFEGKKGITYQIDLHSKAFDAYLYLKDAQDKTLMENDDNGESLDSRIVFTATKTGTYKIVATSLGGQETGPFTLTVKEIK
jgi:hypothetical protein